MAKKESTIPNYQFEPTSDENTQRFVDRHGNWTHYFIKSEGKFVKAVNHILNLGYNKGPRFAEYLLSVTKEEAKRKLENAGEEGSRTHSAIRDLIDGMKVTMSSKYLNELTGRMEMLTPDEWDNLVAFKAWCDVYKPRVISNEFSVACVEYGYAGTPDGLLIVTVPSKDKFFPKTVWGDDVILMPDWKTSSGIRDEYKAQLAAYWIATSRTSMLSGFDNLQAFTGIVRIGTRHKNGAYEMEVWSTIETVHKNFPLFLAAQRIADEYEPKFEPVIEHYPTQFFIKMPKAVVAKSKRTKKPKKIINEA